MKIVQGTQSAAQATQSATQTTRLMSLRVQQDIIALIVQEPELSQKQIAERLKLNVNTVKYYIRKMQEQGRIEHIGSARRGKWAVRERGDAFTVPKEL